MLWEPGSTLGGRLPRTSQMPCQFSIRFWKCGPGWPLALLSSCLQGSEHAILHLLLISSWGPHLTLPAAYIPSTTPHIHILPGHLKCAIRLRGALFSPQGLAWFSICLPVTLWGPVGRLPWQRLPHCVLSLGYGPPFLHLLVRLFAPEWQRSYF